MRFEEVFNMVPETEAEPIWAIEVQAWRDPTIYHRLLVNVGLLGERYPGREVRGLRLFISPGHDPKTPLWDDCLTKATAHCPLRRLYLIKVLDQLQASEPEHLLLAAFLPYLVEDRARLREQAPSRPIVVSNKVRCPTSPDVNAWMYFNPGCWPVSTI